MTDYRIVCDRTTVIKRNGKETSQQNTSCTFSNGRRMIWETQDLDEAKQMLADAIEECAAFDAKTREHTACAIISTQTNIRIQSRERTPWEDL